MDLLIDFKQETTADEITAYLSQYGCQVISVFNSFEKVYHVSCTELPPVTAIVEYIHDNQEPITLLSDTVVMFDSIQQTSININDDKNWWKMASVFDVDFEQDHNHKIYGECVKVYIMDSGVDSAHSEFTGRNIHNLWSFNDDFTDTNGHGTAIASLIVGNTCGLTDATIKVVKIYDNRQTTYISDVLKALDNIANDFDSSKEFGVVNMSWAMPRNTFLDSKIQILIELGLVVVAAAGNSGSPVSTITPAGITDVYTIGAYNDQFTACDFSNYTGANDLSLTPNVVNTGEIDGWAPGQNIYVALPNNRYGFVSGTSFAAPIHAGAIAYMVDLHAFNDDGTIDIPTFGYLRMKPNMDLMVLSRSNILNLPGQYSASVNKITTYPGKNSHAIKKIPFNSIAFISGVKKTILLFNPVNTVSIEILDPLPGNLQILNNGQIVGTLSIDDNIKDGYQTTTHRLKLFRSDGTYDDYELNITVVSKSAFELSNTPDSPWHGLLAAVNCSDITCFRGCPASNPGSTITICDFGPPKYKICNNCLAD